MKPVHYFQRFSKKEDVVTNNTMLLLKRIQTHSSRLFQDILGQILGENSLVVGPEFSEQETSPSKTIPDGVVRQKSFLIVIETKLHANFDVGQLKGHLSSFEDDASDNQVLLLLGTQTAVDLVKIRKEVADFNRAKKKSVALGCTSFAEIVEKCRDVVPEHERALVEMVSDYEEFCAEEGLLSQSDAGLLVVSCSHSFDENWALRLYYDPKKTHRPVKYIGFYQNKSVLAVGEIEAITLVDRVGGKLKQVEGDPLAEPQQRRVIEAMDGASEYGWNIEKGNCFFLSGPMVKTNFKKMSRGPLRGRRYLDLRTELGLGPKAPIPSLKDIALKLSSVEW